MLVASGIFLAACNTAVPTITEPVRVEPGPGELLIEIEHDGGRGVPPWEGFVVRLGEIIDEERIIAIGDTVDGNVLLGSSCEELVVESPEVTDCVEEIDRLTRVINEVVVGPPSSDCLLYTSPSPRDS